MLIQTALPRSSVQLAQVSIESTFFRRGRAVLQQKHSGFKIMNHVTQRCFRDLVRLRFLTLQCRQSAPSGGGESVLVSGADLVAALSNEELRTLMQPGMVSMGRRPAGDGSWMKVSSIPLFWVDKDSGWLQVRWRCNDGCLGDVAEEVKPSYEQMDAVARKEAHRGSLSIDCPISCRLVPLTSEVHQLVVPLVPGEILVIDNRAVAHGRRPYESDEPRVMWRKNYVGNGELETQLTSGMCATFSSMFDGLHSMFDPSSWDPAKIKL